MSDEYGSNTLYNQYSLDVIHPPNPFSESYQKERVIQSSSNFTSHPHAIIIKPTHSTSVLKTTNGIKLNNTVKDSFKTKPLSGPNNVKKKNTSMEFVKKDTSKHKQTPELKPKQNLFNKTNKFLKVSKSTSKALSSSKKRPEIINRFSNPKPVLVLKSVEKRTNKPQVTKSSAKAPSSSKKRPEIINRISNPKRVLVLKSVEKQTTKPQVTKSSAKALSSSKKRPEIINKISNPKTVLVSKSVEKRTNKPQVTKSSSKATVGTVPNKLFKTKTQNNPNVVLSKSVSLKNSSSTLVNEKRISTGKVNIKKTMSPIPEEKEFTSIHDVVIEKESIEIHSQEGSQDECDVNKLIAEEKNDKSLCLDNTELENINKVESNEDVVKDCEINQHMESSEGAENELVDENSLGLENLFENDIVKDEKIKVEEKIEINKKKTKPSSVKTSEEDLGFIKIDKVKTRDSKSGEYSEAVLINDEKSYSENEQKKEINSEIKLGNEKRKSSDKGTNELKGRLNKTKRSSSNVERNSFLKNDISPLDTVESQKSMRPTDLNIRLSSGSNTLLSEIDVDKPKIKGPQLFKRISKLPQIDLIQPDCIQKEGVNDNFDKNNDENLPNERIIIDSPKSEELKDFSKKKLQSFEDSEDMAQLKLIEPRKIIQRIEPHQIVMQIIEEHCKCCTKLPKKLVRLSRL